MYVTQAVACTVQNSATPISPAELAASAARVAAQDAQAAQLLQKWINMIDRTPESFRDLGIVPSQFSQPQSAVELLNLDRHNDTPTMMASFRSGAVCNPSGDSPLVVPLNGNGDALPVNEPVDLLAKGPLGRPEGTGTGMSGYGDLQPYVQAQRIAARRRRAMRPAAHTHGAGMGCHCGGTCGPCKSGMGDLAADGTPVVFIGSILAVLGAVYLFGGKGGR